jgi:CheY-like chemotaxis protein
MQAGARTARIVRMGTAPSKVLLIDDEAMQVKVRGMILQSAGLPVDIATSSDSALALLRSDATIGLVITDHIMPGRSGAEFVRTLRALRPELNIVVLTGLAEAQSEYAGLDVHFREKPLSPEDLIGLAKRLLPNAA